MSDAMEKATEALARANARSALASREATVKNLQWSGKLTKSEKAVLYHATKAYGLDPALREVLVLGGNMYVTVQGLVRIAERSGEYAGCRFEELAPLEEGERRYRCIVRKIVQGQICAFEGLGRASVSNVQSKLVRDQWLDEMAQKRAMGRALRCAWPVSIPTWEESGYEERAALVVTAEMVDEGEAAVEEADREVGEEG
jgi:hypothetical protein